jgi:hypothetical protein
MQFYIRLALQWLVWGLIVAGFTCLSILVMLKGESSLSLLLVGATVCAAPLTQPVRSGLRRRWHAKRNGYDIASAEYRDARRAFAEIYLLRKEIIRGSGLTLRTVVRRQLENGRRTLNETVHYARIVDGFELTERGFSFTLSPVVRRGQTLQAVTAATEKLAANIGYPVVVEPDPAQPVRRAKVEVLLREQIDHLSAPRRAVETQPWLETDHA